MKPGTLVSFTYGRVGGQIKGIGLVLEESQVPAKGLSAKVKVLYKNRTYWVPAHHVKLISQ